MTGGVLYIANTLGFKTGRDHGRYRNYSFSPARAREAGGGSISCAASGQYRAWSKQSALPIQGSRLIA